LHSLRYSATASDVARVAGVSIGTVSHVLNGKVSVSDSLRSQVLSAIEMIGYQRSQMARGLRRNATDMIGMIIPDITNPFFPAIVRGAEDVAYQNGFRLLLGNSDNNPSKELDYLNELRSFRPSGMVIIPSQGTALLAHVNARDPVVFADRCPTDWKGDSVVSANEAGAQKATEFLLHKGHKRIAMIGGLAEFPNARDRMNGFRKAIGKAGITLPADYLQEALFTQDTGFAAMQRLLALKRRPTAVFVANDVMVAGALRAIREAGLDCPRDLSLFGFDDLEFSSFTQPTISSVRQQSYEIGAKSVSLLLQRLAEPNRMSVHIVLETTLSVRNSVSELAK
jgi:DNA-binding LacI/PurR family transcriptional regulator